MTKRTSAIAALFLASVYPLTAQTRETVPLWPHGTPEPANTVAQESEEIVSRPGYPGVKLNRIHDVSTPTITIYPVPPGIHPTGAAAVVFPGGGYQILATILEGDMPCQWFNSLGMLCVVAEYRVPFAKHYPETFAQLEDAQQAIRYVRSHAKAWNLDPEKIGVMGFSAGGHLAVTLSQHFDDNHILSTPAAKDALTNVSARPDFAILGYPAYLPVPPVNTGKEPLAERHALPLDPVLAPNKNTPPTFIVQAENDTHYVDSSLTYATALKNAGVAVQLILFPDGGHGFGMHPEGVTPEHWTTDAADWLRWLKMLPAK